VLDAARPLLTAHRRLPGLLFSVCMPFVRRLKSVRDDVWLLTTRDAKPHAIAGGVAGGA
jgi:hypothetical protein